PNPEEQTRPPFGSGWLSPAAAATWRPATGTPPGEIASIANITSVAQARSSLFSLFFQPAAHRSEPSQAAQTLKRKTGAGSAEVGSCREKALTRQSGSGRHSGMSTDCQATGASRPDVKGWAMSSAPRRGAALPEGRNP